jgi:Domain of unknown function (DUF4352)
MRTVRPLFKLFVSLTALGLLAAACASPTPTATNPIVVPTKAAATAAPTTAANPTTAPTTAAKPTAQPTAMASEQPTAAASAQPATQPTAEASAMPATQAMTFGTSMTVGDIALTPSKVERMLTVGSDTPKQGDIFVVVTLSVSNTNATASATFDPASLAIAPGSSMPNILPSELAGITDAIKVQDIPANGKVDGRVAFDVPQSALSLQLIYTGAKDQQEVWNVPDPTLGTKLEIGSLALTPMTAERMDSSGSDTPQTGNQYLILTIDIQNVGTTDVIHFDPASLLLMAPDMTQGLAPVSLASLTDQLTAQDIKPGASLHGVVAFEVPMADTNLEVTYQSQDNQTARWALTG